MAEGQKATELSECPAECEAASDSLDLSLKNEALSSSSPTFEEPVSMQSPSRPTPPGLLSMPCLLKELHQDSSPEALAPEKGPSTSVIQICTQEDSDSSACLRSPSSSGHLGDSDTLSSLEEVDVELTDAKPASSSQSAPRKSSRRSRSGSDASAGVAMGAKKNRCQAKQANGGRTRERGKRSQRHKERMRLLRQKREAVAKRKSRPLEDSSTSDSDATAHTSSSASTASSDNEGTAGGLHPPGPVEVAPPQVSLPLSDSEVEIVGVQENTSAVSRFPRGGVIQSLSAWKQTAVPHWTAVSAQPDWASPPEVVDLTLDEDRHRYLL